MLLLLLLPLPTPLLASLLLTCFHHNLDRSPVHGLFEACEFPSINQSLTISAAHTLLSWGVEAIPAQLMFGIPVVVSLLCGQNKLRMPSRSTRAVLGGGGRGLGDQPREIPEAFDSALFGEFVKKMPGEEIVSFSVFSSFFFFCFFRRAVLGLGVWLPRPAAFSSTTTFETSVLE